MKVGVVLPVLDGARYVEDAIDSVLASTHERFELVVVDGGSTDGTVSAVRDYDDPRITLVETDAGIAASRNRGVEVVDGDLLAFIDHDDVWAPEKLGRHVRTHRETGADLVYSDARVVGPDGSQIRAAPRPEPKPPGEPLVRQLLLEDRLVILSPSSVTICRSAWAAVGGYDPTFRRAEDAELYVRLAGTHRFERLPETLVDKRSHEGNVSDDYRAMYEAHERLVELAIDRYPFLDDDDERRRRARNAYSRATSALAAGASREAIRYGRESLGYDPRLRPLAVVLLGSADVATGPLDLGSRLFAAYDRRTRG